MQVIKFPEIEQENYKRGIRNYLKELLQDLEEGRIIEVGIEEYSGFQKVCFSRKVKLPKEEVR